MGFGVLALLASTGAVDLGETVTSWWPVPLIVLAGADIATTRAIRVPTIILGLGGLVLLGATTGVFGGKAVGLLGPIVLIALGVAVIAGWSARRTVVEDPRFSRIVVGAAPKVVVRSTPFEGGTVTLVAGSLRVDLSRAVIERSATLSITVVAGGGTVIVPDGWNVVVKGVSILGGWDDTTARSSASDAPRLDISVLAVLGGIDVRHRRRWAEH